VLFYVLFVCKCVLPPGDNPTAVNKYIIYQISSVDCLGLSYFATLPHKRYDFRKKNIILHKMCVLIFSTNYIRKSSYSKKDEFNEILSQMYVGPRVKHRYIYQILTKLELSRNIFEKYTNIKFYEKPSSGSRFASCGWSVVTKLIVIFFQILRMKDQIFANLRQSIAFLEGSQASLGCPSGKRNM